MSLRSQAIRDAVRSLPRHLVDALPRGYSIRTIVHDGEIAHELHELGGGFVCSSFEYLPLVETAIELSAASIRYTP
jgi:hypothetical protein